MVSDKVLSLCQATETVTSTLAQKPEATPGDVVQKLYGHLPKDIHRPLDEHGAAPSPEDEERASRCGRWGPTRPSRLFLQAFGDALGCLDADATAGVVSPPLMGTHGRVPLTAVATVPEVMRHCANLIARAESDVLLVTCAWSPSLAQRLLRAALMELSRRAGRRGRRVVAKIMYDKAGLSNAVDAHQSVSPHGSAASVLRPAAYTSKAIQLPAPDEIPHVRLDVISYHRFVLGTLHAKFCVVDGKHAVVMSNNVEDNCNMEMMCHLEGPVVASIYDAALISWNKALDPVPPSLLRGVRVEGGEGQRESPDPGSGSGLGVGSGSGFRSGSGPAPVSGAGSGQDTAGHLQEQQRDQQHGQQRDDQQNHQQDASLAEHSPEDPHYDQDIAGEIRRMQSCYSSRPGETPLEAANRLLNRVSPNPVAATGPDIAVGDEMTPYISTETREAVPMALVSRPPYGPVDSKNAHVPQNEAWLSLIRNCRESILIQTPDLNAKPLLPALAAAVRRGVRVTYYVCFGYNDAGEQMPGQGGNNEKAAQTLLRMLPAEGPERERLAIHHYVAKDQDRPIHQARRARACHIKLLIADGAVAVQGSGNMDTQSWFHSQEMNVMIDSPDICARWAEVIERNQNTRAFGRVTGDDGVWRDAEGNTADGYLGDPNLFKAVVGMVKMKGMGGF